MEIIIIIRRAFVSSVWFLLLTGQQLFAKDPSSTAPTPNHPPNHPANQPTTLVMNWLPVTLVAASGSWPAVFFWGRIFL